MPVTASVWPETAGAALGNMDEGWWMPALAVPGEELDGVAYYRPLHGERAQPGAIMVDGSGRRFVNEAQNYGDVGRAMAARQPAPSGSSSTPPTAAAIRSALSVPLIPTRPG